MQSYIIHESASSSLPNVLHKNEDYVEFVAILQTADTKNRNGRYYPRAVLEEAIKAPYIQDRLRTKTLWSELNHPADQSLMRQATIDINNIAVVITSLYWEGNCLMGRCETLPTQKGRDVMALLKSGARIAFSMRGQGKVHQDTTLDATVVEPGLCIITFDIVVSPSHADAYMQYFCEDSFASLVNLNNYNGNKRLALTESLNLANNGELINLGEEIKPELVDYASHYHAKRKPLSQYYAFKESDQVMSISPDKKFMTILSEDGTYKKVVAEDYIKKDIRSRIRNI